MTPNSNSDVGRAIAALGASSMNYRTFPPDHPAPLSPAETAERVAGFSLLLAAMPEARTLQATASEADLAELSAYRADASPVPAMQPATAPSPAPKPVRAASPPASAAPAPVPRYRPAETPPEPATSYKLAPQPLLGATPQQERDAGPRTPITAGSRQRTPLTAVFRQLQGDNPHHTGHDGRRTVLQDMLSLL